MPTLQPGGEFREVYLYTISNSAEVQEAMGVSADPAVQPNVTEMGPYYYAVTWNYTDFVRMPPAERSRSLSRSRPSLLDSPPPHISTHEHAARSAGLVGGPQLA